MATVVFTEFFLSSEEVRTSAETSSEHQSSETRSTFADSSPAAVSFRDFLVIRTPCASIPSMDWVPKSSTSTLEVDLKCNWFEHSDRG
jgi:hypothetical protein